MSKNNIDLTILEYWQKRWERADKMVKKLRMKIGDTNYYYFGEINKILERNNNERYKLEVKIKRADKRAKLWRGLTRQYEFDMHREKERAEKFLGYLDEADHRNEVTDLRRIGWKFVTMILLGVIVLLLI